MRIHTCPRCALRFADLPELRDHMVTDHRFLPTQVDDRLVGAMGTTRRHRPNVLAGGNADD